jgi:hypothetical protein
VTRQQHILHPHAAARRLAIDLNVLVAAKGHQVRDRLARRSHGEHIADARLDQAEHGRIVDRVSLLIELDLDDLLPNLGSRAVRAQQQAERRHQRGPRQPLRHQKTFLTRQSRA